MGTAFLDKMIAFRGRIESGEEGLDQARTPARTVRGVDRRVSSMADSEASSCVSLSSLAPAAALCHGPNPPSLVHLQEFVMGAAADAGARRCALPKTLFAGYCEDAHDELSRLAVRYRAPRRRLTRRLPRGGRSHF